MPARLTADPNDGRFDDSRFDDEEPAAVGVSYAAIVLAGGAGRRLGGVDKPALEVGGRSMLQHVLGTVTDATVRVVVGPPREGLPGGVLVVREQPPGGGPVAATAAGLAAVPVGGAEWVAVLAADLPWLNPAAIARLGEAVVGTGLVDGPVDGVGPVDGPVDLTAQARTLDRPSPDERAVDGAVLVDNNGRRQLLCGLWRRNALERRLAAVGDPAGVPMRSLLEGLSVVEVATEDDAWFDCDTADDLRRARSQAPTRARSQAKTRAQAPTRAQAARAEPER